MKNNIDIVITMGGLGSRFRKSGYTLPKYMIQAKGRTLFEWSLISLEGYKDKVDQYIFIAVKDSAADVENFISESCNKLDIKNYKTDQDVQITFDTAKVNVFAKDSGRLIKRVVGD